MTHFEVWLLAVGLAMDCFTISIASGIILRRWQVRTILRITVLFGLFQGLMPLIGWLVTRYVSGVIESFDHWIAFSLLAFLGGKMIVEGAKEQKEHCFDPSKLLVVLTLAVATSIDALAVGISFTCMGLSDWNFILYPIAVIAFVSSLFSLVGYAIGVSIGKRFRFPAEFVGGIILIAIGCRVLWEHLVQ